MDSVETVIPAILVDVGMLFLDPWPEPPNAFADPRCALLFTPTPPEAVAPPALPDTPWKDGE
jgi:hypothetical protein